MVRFSGISGGSADEAFCRGNGSHLSSGTGLDSLAEDRGQCEAIVFQLTPYFGIGYYDWQRAVNTGEEYSHGYAGVGLLAQWNPVARLVLSAHGLVGGTFGSQIDIHTIPGPGGIIGSTLALGHAGTERSPSRPQGIHGLVENRA
jgi:hypothetical protein